MERNRLMMIAAVLAAVVVVAGGFLLGIQPQLRSASTAQATEANVTSQNAALSANLATLRSQFSKLDSLKAQLAAEKQSVPSGVASAQFITELNGIASSSDVTISNITFGTPAAYVPPVSATPAATSTGTATASPSASASASASATAAPVPTASTPAAPTVATSPLVTAANFSDIPVTVQIQGSYTKALEFLQGLRDGKRLFLVTSITTQQATGASTSGSSSATGGQSWTFGGLIYALTDSTTATQQQSTATSTAAGAASGNSTTDAAAGK